MFKRRCMSLIDFIDRKAVTLIDKYDAYVRREKLREDAAYWNSIWSDDTKAQASYFNQYINTSMVNKDWKVLDIGCGDLLLSHAYRNRDRLFVGVDISKVALKGAQMHMGNGAFVKAAGTNLPFSDNSFDTVTALDIVSVMGKQSVSLLKEMRRVTADKIVFNVAHKNRFRKCHSSDEFEYGEIVGPSRFRLAIFDEESLVRLLRDSKLEPLMIKTFTENERAQYVPKESHTSQELREMLGNNTESHIVAIVRKS